MEASMTSGHATGSPTGSGVSPSPSRYAEVLAEQLESLQQNLLNQYNEETDLLRAANDELRRRLQQQNRDPD
ncbi:pll, partial [Symbiodinium sp. KB8]